MLVDALVTATLSATSATVNVKLVLLAWPSAFGRRYDHRIAAFIQPDCDQLHVPLWLPDCVSVPCEALIVTASS